MRFRRKSTDDDPVDFVDGEVGAAASDAGPDGPFDADELPADDVERVDLGSLLIAPEPGRELRLQVDEASGQVQSVMLAGSDGAVEIRAFAAPRNGDLWSEVRPQIAADMAQRGGTTTEREGRFGTELVCSVQVKRPEGGTATQPSRILGINGSRWLLRATLLGRPAVEFDATDWEDTLTQVAVRRGTHALPVGEPLPLVLPEQAQRVEPTVE